MKVNDVLDELQQFENEGGQSSLPKLPKDGSRSKFSSWNTADQATKQNSDVKLETNFMDEVDELLLE